MYWCIRYSSVLFQDQLKCPPTILNVKPSTKRMENKLCVIFDRYAISLLVKYTLD